jgi:two-component system response regulator RegA
VKNTVKKKRVKLLLVEDDIPLANALRRRLEKHHYTCWHVTNSNDALLACHQHRPDYILLDMKLGNESGLALISPIRQLLVNSRIILLTGYASIATAVEAIKMGADDYLSKPVDSKTLLAALANNNVTLEGNAEATANTLSVEKVEWEHIQQVLKANDGNVSATARQLSMHRRTLQRKLQKRPSTLL